MKCIVSCEHASNSVPPGFTHLFKAKENVLSSHLAYDPGAASQACRLARRIKSSVYLGTISRLLIDLNRSPSNRKSLYTLYSRKLHESERELLVQKYYFPYREKVEAAVAGIIGKGDTVLHISLHSFVPVKSGKIRKADIGLLYDPARKIEKNISRFLAGLLQQKVVSLRIRRNYPYLGKTDGFTSFLRKKYSAKFYAGIEIEINQALLFSEDNTKKKTEDVLAEGIRMILKLQNFSKFANLV